MSLQKMFLDYNDVKSLKQSDYDEMISKRDIIIKEIRGDENVPEFKPYNLGSYKLKTGVNYNDNKYDIDCGLVFTNTNEMNANQFKQSVYNAIYNTRKKQFNTKCLTARYQEDEKPLFHIDFPIYHYNTDEDQYYLADGKQGNVNWIKAEPIKLIDWLNFDYASTNINQSYKRCVRYFKLWKSKVFSQSATDSIPPSIAFNITCRHYFESCEKKDDIYYLIDICTNIQKQFGAEWNQLFLQVPYTHYNENVYYKLLRDKSHVIEFKSKLEEFINALRESSINPSLDSTCRVLRKFLPDFPLPEKEESTKSPHSINGRYGL